MLANANQERQICTTNRQYQILVEPSRSLKYTLDYFS